MTDRSQYRSLDQSISQIVKHLRGGNAVSPHVLIGPLVWEGDPDDRQWYSVLDSGDRHGFRCDKLAFKTDKEFGEKTIASLHCALIQEKSIVVHIFDDELEMARWAHAIWPSPKTRKIREDIAAERQSNAAP
jgi:hypothetical protein